MVELIGRNSNLGHLCKKWADLRKCVQESPPRARPSSPPPRSKRFLSENDIADIITSYHAGATTKQLANRYGISKTRVATVLRERGITLRRQGLKAEQVRKAITYYAAGRSLAWIATRLDVSHTTVAATLRRQGIQLRPRPGWR
jgi:DNA invertase Pin-like site-specific DNA recombinase